MVNSGYIHTFSKKEQDRLLRQGQFLEPYFYSRIDFGACRRILEIGCGVGAQISIVARKFPDLTIDGVDLVESQINRARTVLESLIASERVSLTIASAYELPFPSNYYDGVCIFCVLEHIDDPLAALKEARRVLKPAGVFYCTEVFNSGLYIYPDCPTISEYWAAFNQCQIGMGGDPDIGMKLVNLASRAGFEHINFHDVSSTFDRRIASKSRRIEFLDFWKSLFLSASDKLISQGKVTPEIVLKLHEEFDDLTENRDAVFSYAGKQIECYK
ncbi:MAG: methyltransferase domain-containing protein [Candidatus Contendobacter sp.]|nr:methyltransferase domain-containing protein [Candidatus Contendobacter sp.]